MFSLLKTAGRLNGASKITNNIPKMTLGLRNLFIQTLETPNEHALKFLPSMQILKENETKEFLSGREASISPLAMKLFSIDGIKSVMFGSDFITIEKDMEEMHWSILKPEIFSILTEYLTSGTPIIDDNIQLGKDLEINDDDDDVVAMIKELIFTRIRPAIQDDGGDIEFIRFSEPDGKVVLRLKGACRSCDSSSVTLKNGIESMLQYYIEEVQSVEQFDESGDVVQDESVTEPEPNPEPFNLTPKSRDPPSL